MKTFLSLFACAGAAAALAADLPPDTKSILSPGVAAKPSPHWVWLNDMSFMRLTDGRAYLVDADQGSMLGMISTGFNFVSVLPSRDGSVIYSPETYFSRGVRGTRTDVVTLYDPVQLAPVAEIEIPAKRASAIPMANQSALTDDDRFLLIYNFTPAQSTTVVDTTTRKFVTELDTAGCAMAFPTGARSFFSICSDASLLVVRLDDHGQLASAAHSKPLFEREKDPITEKGVRLGDTWYFTSYESNIHPIKADASGRDGRQALAARHRRGARGRLAHGRAAAACDSSRDKTPLRDHAQGAALDAQGSGHGRVGL